MSVELNKIIPQTVDIYMNDCHGNKEFFATVNEYEWLDIRIQIKNEESDRFFVYFNGEYIRINKKGQPEHWPKEMFDLMDRSLDILLCWD